MKNQFVLIVMLYLAFPSYSQIQFLNQQTNEPIPNVKIFNEEGKILSISSSTGKSFLKRVENSESDTVNIFHPNFKIEYLPYKKLLENDKHILVPSDYENLEQVVISSDKPRYLKISGYYLSYQLIDDKPQSFSDGVIEFFIDLKKSKVKDYNIKESRTFKDKNYISKLKKTKPKAVSMLGANLLPFSFEEEILLNEWQNRDQKFSEVVDEDWVGNFSTQKNGSTLTIEYQTPENPRKISLLGLKTVIDHHLIQEEFYSTDPKVENLKSVTKYFSSEREKKGEKIEYELEQDFFISDFEYIDKDELKLATDETNHNTSTNFSSDFWSPFQSFVPPAIQEKLYEDIKLIK